MLEEDKLVGKDSNGSWVPDFDSSSWRDWRKESS